MLTDVDAQKMMQKVEADGPEPEKCSLMPYPDAKVSEALCGPRGSSNYRIYSDFNLNDEDLKLVIPEYHKYCDDVVRHLFPVISDENKMLVIWRRPAVVIRAGDDGFRVQEVEDADQKFNNVNPINLNLHDMQNQIITLGGVIIHFKRMIEDMEMNIDQHHNVFKNNHRKLRQDILDESNRLRLRVQAGTNFQHNNIAAGNARPANAQNEAGSNIQHNDMHEPHDSREAYLKKRIRTL
ncbi:hypothetical protein SARC_06624 [Sphaeroforma arctica JP610]|uniref:Uncharacterized protein n=1 Tax=Sphaeroforma arctica JP610 TaxID=667725 RepID=A0A0L0FW10_9EUKA|nr:hypothetical protein SARC_06624 [Sphaeroforma arctica JP610]KNC81030.1 hypothetical protein SARC_06624 [Sphaeroforma arctica JP610]|eukprot:XP_014154932.1 hypothetical protein SARC_06624 [Sphaeroforma arctica JP610]